MTFQGTVEDGKIILDELVKLPNGSRVEVEVKAQSKAASPLGQALLQLAGTAVGLPEDMAEQHDHYIHGTPKR